MGGAIPTGNASFVSCELSTTHRGDGCMTFCATFPRGLYFTATTEVLWMDFMTAARRLHRSWAWLTCTLGGSLRITVSAEPSRTLGRNSPSFTCKESEKRRSTGGFQWKRCLMNCLPVRDDYIDRSQEFKKHTTKKLKRLTFHLSAACVSTHI